jgi:hypothetical protein
MYAAFMLAIEHCHGIRLLDVLEVRCEHIFARVYLRHQGGQIRKQ